MSKNKVFIEHQLEISPQPLHDEEIAGVFFVKDSNLVRVSTELFIEDLPRRSDGFFLINGNEYEEKIKRKVRKLIVLNSIHNEYYSPIDIKVIKHEILNKKELASLGYEIRTIFEKFVSFVIPCFSANGYYSEANDYWLNGFQGKTKGFQNDLTEVAEIIIKGVSEKDIVKSFVMHYIAFNYLYTNFSLNICKLKEGERHNKNEIENIIKNLLSDEDCKRLHKSYSGDINGLIQLDIVEWSRSGKSKTDLSDQLKDAVSVENNHKEVIILSCKCIWKIRNEIFHNSIGVENILQKAEKSKNILNGVLAVCMKRYIYF